MKKNIYNHKVIEKKWQKEWAKKKIYKTKDVSNLPKCYVLDMFPYPSGEGLHVGHPKGYIATDVLSRFKRMNGFNVLHPMGWDAFGLPAENYAIKNKIHPRKAVGENIKRFKEQLSIIGLDYDWSREINTTDPKYYKWTQWTFLQMLKKGLAYESNEPVNWCPSCKTVLANEDLENGKCERCGSEVEKKAMRQWVLKITDYADRLLEDLDVPDESTMPHVVDKKNPPQAGKKSVKRKTIHALVRNPKTGKFLALKWKKFPWITFIVGGVKEGESVIDAAKREVTEETGYKNISFVKILGGPIKAEYFAAHKNENRVAYTTGVLFELVSDKREKISEEEQEKHEPIWVEEKDINDEMFTCAELSYWTGGLKGDVVTPKLLLNWPESIKESQRNWIGRSEGAEIRFTIYDLRFKKGEGEVAVFTTRPDTLFGATYLVLAPEHPLVAKLLEKNQELRIKNQDEVIRYIVSSKKKTEIERTAEGKEKTGIELQGVKAINPATKKEIPVWIADYVLADYGTGAIMAVPAHDERDWDFAKKYNLPIKEVMVPLFKTTTGQDAVRVDKQTVKRKTIYVIVKHWKENKILGLRWNKFGWQSPIIGGVEDGEDESKAAIREVQEETGYKNIKYVKGGFGHHHSNFFAGHKDVNRYADGIGIYVELLDGERKEVDEYEKKTHEPVWIDFDKMGEFINLKNLNYLWDCFAEKQKGYTGSGILVNSGKFDGMDSEEAKLKIAESVGGKKVVKYKLRDWVFSRQRYWGEPIPVIHCEKCGVVPVPEKNLPVMLPEVKSYKPTGTGQSPLAAISKWVNVKCPKCKGPAKRETNTMPQWAGSSWYYLRYEDPKNSKELVDNKKEKYWSPVDMYVGGAEHATRHLIYARFWHKFLYDIGAVNYIEPFSQLKNQGLIMGADGKKMSKRFGNVVNPDDMVKLYGADTLRIYEMFMGPFENSINWSTDNMIGSRRFLEKVWRLAERAMPAEPASRARGSKKNSAEKTAPSPEAESLLHSTIKKVSEDIGNFSFNTAISSMMILANGLEKEPALSKEILEKFLVMLAPFAPHMTEELWQVAGRPTSPRLRRAGKTSIHLEKWPSFDQKKISAKEIRIAVQINGKVRDMVSFGGGEVSENEALEKAKASSTVKKWIDGKEIKKVIYIKNRVLNIVV